MVQIIRTLMSWLAPAVLMFFTPQRCVALFKMFMEVVEGANEHADAKNDEERYDAALETLCDSYDAWDKTENYEDSVDDLVKNKLFPFVLSFVYGGNDEEIVEE